MFSNKKIKQFVIIHKTILYCAKPYFFIFNKINNFNSKIYWEERYVKGGNSGSGSYGRLAEFKAEVINEFVNKNNINLVIEFGCGDGNQLSFFEIPNYIGLDVSKKSIELCKNYFINDKKKSFFLYDPQYFVDKFSLFQSDLTLSLDVIFHLAEDNVFNKYMNDLFSASRRFVIIYSSNTDKNKINRLQHIKHRNFSKWIDKNMPEWNLLRRIKNEYPLESFSDFYVYQKK